MTCHLSSVTILSFQQFYMSSCIADRVRDARAVMLLAKSMAEALFLDFGLKPGESIRVGDFVVTAPQPARFAPFIEPLNKEIETAA